MESIRYSGLTQIQAIQRIPREPWIPRRNRPVHRETPRINKTNIINDNNNEPNGGNNRGGENNRNIAGDRNDGNVNDNNTNRANEGVNDNEDDNQNANCDNEGGNHGHEDGNANEDDNTNEDSNANDDCNANEDGNPNDVRNNLRSVATIANLATGRSSSDAVMEHNSDSISNATTKDAKVGAEELESKRRAVKLESESNRSEESVMTLVFAATIANLATGRSSSDAVMEPKSDCVSISKMVPSPNYAATIASLPTGCSSNNAVTGATTTDHCDIIMDEVLDDSDNSIASQLSSSNESIVRQLMEKKMK